MSRYSSFYPVKNIVGGLVDDLFNRSISDLVGGDFAASIPSVNLKETDKDYQLEMAAPGLEKEDFKINLENKQLVISVEKEKEASSETADKFLRKEFSYFSFKRSFGLPENVHTEGISGTYDKGILRVTLPKSAPKADTVTQIHIS